MDDTKLSGKRVAILSESGFEQVELLKPRLALEEAGARVDVVSPQRGKIQGWNHQEKGEQVAVDVTLDKARVEDYDALVLPGGVMNPDQLRQDPGAVRFIRAFFDAGKPIGAICHGPWTLIEADVVRGRKVTSWPSLKTDLRNAGASWVDQEVVTDQGLTTSRKPADLPAFNRALIEQIAGARGAALRGPPRDAG